MHVMMNKERQIIPRAREELFFGFFAARLVQS